MYVYARQRFDKFRLYDGLISLGLVRHLKAHSARAPGGDSGPTLSGRHQPEQRAFQQRIAASNRNFETLISHARRAQNGLWAIIEMSRGSELAPPAEFTPAVLAAVPAVSLREQGFAHYAIVR